MRYVPSLPTSHWLSRWDSRRSTSLSIPKAGRCEECKGAGYVTIEMQFMADLTLTCEACKGKRFKHDILEVRYGGKNVNDVLNMTVNEAIEVLQR